MSAAGCGRTIARTISAELLNIGDFCYNHACEVGQAITGSPYGLTHARWP